MTNPRKARDDSRSQPQPRSRGEASDDRGEGGQIRLVGHVVANAPAFPARLEILDHLVGDVIVLTRGGDRLPLGEGAVDGRLVTCPSHGFTIDLAAGRSPHAPRLRVRTFAVEGDGDHVRVTIPGR